VLCYNQAIQSPIKAKAIRVSNLLFFKTLHISWLNFKILHNYGDWGGYLKEDEMDRRCGTHGTAVTMQGLLKRYTCRLEDSIKMYLQETEQEGVD
jgi:hypothetical protein